MKPAEFPERVRAYIAKHGLIQPGDRVLVAVSGGVDSMVLLHVLRELGFDIHVAHFDHLTRNDESTRDAEFVADHCRELGVPCEVEQWQRSLTVGSKGSFEMQAREARYEYLAATSKKHACDVIATGQHFDDQAETILFRILRGTGPEGLRGIAPARRFYEDPLRRHTRRFAPRGAKHRKLGVRVVRPLLAVSRAEIEDYARASGLDWRYDVTNADFHHQRNWIRHALLPLVAREFNPKISVALARLAETMRCENDLIDELMREKAGQIIVNGMVHRAPFRLAHEALQRRLVRNWLLPREAANSFDLVLAAVEFIRSAPAGNQMSIDKDINLVASRDRVSFLKLAPEDEIVALKIPGETPFQGQVFSAMLSETAPSVPLNEYCNESRQIFDADAIGPVVAVFAGGTANSFVPLGSKRAKKLHEYLKDRQVPLAQRLSTPVILAKNSVAWVVGHAPSALYAVTPDTKRFAIIEVHHAFE